MRVVYMHFMAIIKVPQVMSRRVTVKCGWTAAANLSSVYFITEAPQILIFFMCL